MTRRGTPSTRLPFSWFRRRPTSGEYERGRNITEGDIYHVMMYGLNSMGSYASQTNEKERWQITMHALDLKSKLNGEPLWSSTQKDTMEKETTSNEAN